MPILDRFCWDAPILLNQEIVYELHFWLKNIDTLPFRTLAPINRIPERIVFADASSHAGAAVMLESVNQVVHCMFDDNTINESSTFRELKAVQYAICSLKSLLSCKFVKLYTDNQNVVRIVSVGSMNRKLQDLAVQIFNMCIEFKICLDVAWVPRDLNTSADYFSKIFYFDDWAVSNHIFKLFDVKWGPHTLDRFADHKNTKVSKFNSLFGHLTALA